MDQQIVADTVQLSHVPHELRPEQEMLRKNRTCCQKAEYASPSFLIQRPLHRTIGQGTSRRKASMKTLSSMSQQGPQDLKLRFPGRREDFLSRYRGYVLLLQIISTRCGSCAKMVLLLNALMERFGPAGFQALGVAVNPNARNTLPAFLATSGATFPFSFCPADEVREFLSLPKGEPVRIPVIAFLDRQGRIYETSRPETEFYDNAETAFPRLIHRLLEHPAPPDVAPAQEEHAPLIDVEPAVAAECRQQELIEAIEKRSGSPVDLVLHLADRTQLQLKALRNKVVLLVLLSVDCSACAALVKDLNRLAEELRSVDAEIVGTTVNPNDNRNLLAFIDRSGARFRVGYTPLKTVHAGLQIPLGTWLLYPSFVFIDRHGCKRALLNGFAGSENDLVNTAGAGMEALLEEEPV